MRPNILIKDKTQFWVIHVYDTDGLLVDADAVPTVTVRKNGSSVADIVTVTKRATTTGIYDCSYNPAGEVEGDVFTLAESILRSAVPYDNVPWNFSVVSAMRGTDGANTVIPATPTNVTDAQAAIIAQGNLAWTTAVGFSTHSAADVLTAFGTGSTLTACLTATGFSTHAASDVVTAMQLVAGDFKADVMGLATSAELAIIAGYIDTEITELLTDSNEIQNQLIDLLSLVEGITITGSATFLGADTYTLTTGTLVSGTIEDTKAASGVNHVHTDAAGAIEVEYTYQMGASEVGVELLFRGRVDGPNDTIAVQVYDWVGAAWDTLWNQVGNGGTSATSRAEPLLAKHSGTGANDGEVRVRFFASSGLTAATLYVDQLLVAKTAALIDKAAIRAAMSGMWTNDDDITDRINVTIEDKTGPLNIQVSPETGRRLATLLKAY